MSVECGQVLWLRVRFNNSSRDVSPVAHPYLVLRKDEETRTVEVGQLDTLAGKEYKAAFQSNKTVLVTDPTETVLTKDGYLQMDNIFLLEDYPGLGRFRRTEDKLSEKRFEETLSAYTAYQEGHHISEDKIVYMAKDELEALN